MKRFSILALSLVMLALPTLAAEEPKRVPVDIVETLRATGTFKTFLTALEAADLVETLKGAGPLTVFVPTDAAFAKLPAGTMDDLLKPENKERLRSILSYHILPGRMGVVQVISLHAAKTLEGSSVGFTATAGGLTVDSVRIELTEEHTTNGVIHVINAVLMPKTK